ncbi:fatty acyl-AMP ligase [Nocardioides sp. Y6]|uniref:Fatty acyl-AMP ligase n=1 Tax=Nocardioides malaquae TaxID=2773426 RepID=A0ABR9RSP5_9ACTN|nr:fatty acyl-AMP ligase [Nocardioides malaquae]MBE7324165.1 fatty acyl-AMP ligase [Nocardioides malaquae]
MTDTVVESLLDTTTHETLVSLVARGLASQPDRPVFTAVDAEGVVEATLTMADLDRKARLVAAALRTHGEAGDRVIVPLLGGVDFQVGFLGCLYAGMVAVPVPALEGKGSKGKGLARLTSIITDCAPVAVLVSDAQGAEAATADLPDVPWVSVEQPNGAGLEPEQVTPSTVAMLQYTSGSTADARGVVITHRNLVSNQSAMADAGRIGPQTTVVTWLPMFHDMGLCTGFVLPVVSGANTVLIQPWSFVRNPLVWLQQISRYDDVFSAAPNFAYEMCVTRIGADERAGLDLSGWRLAVNGSEPVSGATIRRFVETFSGVGFTLGTMRPGYGLAECTLAVAGGGSGEEAPMLGFRRDSLAQGVAVAEEGPDSVELVGNGRAFGGMHLLVVDRDTLRPLEDGRVGEIWVHSPSNGQGYWQRPEVSVELFEARPVGADPDGPTYVRTGDLGFLYEDNLFITGRTKDLVIIAGTNYYPQDLEAEATAAHPLFAHMRAGAWQSEVGGRTGVTVAIEAPDADEETLAKAARAAGIAVAKAVPAPVRVLVLPLFKLPKTTSGKIRRGECAARAEAGVLPVRATWAPA